jgi:hypothetical protein
VPIEPSILQIFFVSAVTMGISYTLAYERLFEPLRRKLGGKETFFGYLLACPYCNSHWVAFVLAPLTGTWAVRIAPDWGLAGSVLDWFLSSYLIVVIAAFLRVIFFWVDETQGLVRRQQVETEAETEAQRVLRRRAEQQLKREGAPEGVPPKGPRK